MPGRERRLAVVAIALTASDDSEKSRWKLCSCNIRIVIIRTVHESAHDAVDGSSTGDPDRPDRDRTDDILALGVVIDERRLGGILQGPWRYEKCCEHSLA